MAEYYIEALLPPGQPRWNSGSNLGTPVNVTYSFMTRVPTYYASNAPEQNNFVPFNNDQIDAAGRALVLYSEVANISFTEVPEIYINLPLIGSIELLGGNIRFGTASTSNNHAYYPGSNTGGDLWLNNTDNTNLTQTNGSWGFWTMLHEIGHTLGLKHSGNYDSGGGGTPGPYLPLAEDSNQYTVMSYDGFGGGTRYSGSEAFSQTPMLYDIAAIQYLYGANSNTRAGDDTYSWDPHNPFVMTIWDGGGINDTISAENQIVPVTIDLRAGHFSSIGPRSSGDLSTAATNNLAIAYGVTIENAYGGSGNDTIIGNNANNVLQGNGGDDSLNGGEGNNILNAGEGNNTVTAGSGNDIVYAGAGNDTISTNGGDDQIYAGDGNNTIDAGDGTNKIYAGTGYDYISAGTGDDQIYAGDGGSTIFAGAGNNKVYAGTGYDSVYAEDGDDLISVGDGGSTIRAGNGKNTIYAGTGDDEVYTGTSDDEIHVGEGNNSINAGSGKNTISAGSGNDVIDTSAGDDTIYANEGLNTIRAGDGNNKIYSGSGGDFIFAGSGDDEIYAGEGQNYIDAGNGINKIYSGASSDFILAGNGNDLIYAGEGSNRISAGNGDNTIYAGAGNDEISTGSGDDLIYAGEGNNLIATGTGFDTVYAGSGVDRFSLSEGLGAVTIIGFQATQDSFIGASPLSFSIFGNDTFVNLTSSSDILAIVKDVQLV